jgi:hypothetical protein
VSLVSDALRKARQETAQREGRVPRQAPRPPSRHEVRRPGLGIGVMVGVIFGSLAAVIGGVAVWSIVGQHGRRAASAEPIERTAPVVDPAVTIEEPAGAHPVPGTTHARAAAATAAADAAETRSQPIADDPGPASRPEVVPAARSGSFVPPADTSADQPVVGDDSPPTAAAPASEGGVFVLDAELGDVSLSLGYIIFKASDPVAEINGREVRVGSHVEGFRVDVIEQTRVTLRDDTRTVVLSTY